MIFNRSKQTNRDCAVGLDLGAQQIKAAVLQRAEGACKLGQYVVARTSATAQRTGSSDALEADLRSVLDQLGLPECSARVTISCGTATVCETEVPRMPIEEVRAAFKLPANSMKYLRRDLSAFCVDAIELSEAGEDAGKSSPTMRILIAAAPRDEVLWYRDALLRAKIKPVTLELSAISVVNAFQLNFPAADEREATLLIDIGAQTTSINAIRGGRLLMSRIMQFGGNQVSDFIGSMLTLPAPDAENAKIELGEPVQPLVRQALIPLAREVRSSIDFFERQHECHVGRAFACGGSACSPRILEFLSEEVGVGIESWDPSQNLDISHFNGQAPQLKSVAPSLAGAIGAAAPLLQ